MKATQKRDLLLNTGSWALVQNRDRRTLRSFSSGCTIYWRDPNQQVDGVWPKQIFYHGLSFFNQERDVEHLNKQVCINSLVSRLRQTPVDCGNPKTRTTSQTHDQEFYLDQMLTVTDVMLFKTKDAT